MSEPPTLRILETRLDGPDEDQNQSQQAPTIDQNYPYDELVIGDEGTYGPESTSFIDPDQLVVMTSPLFRYEQEVGIYGWRKKILYIFLIVNVVLVGVNFGLAFWIISVLGFSSDGITGIDLSPPETPNQIKFKGSALFQKLLFAREVHSYPPDQFLKFTSKNGDIIFRTIWSNDSDKQIMNQTTEMILTKDKIIMVTDSFEIYDKKKRLMFALDSFEYDREIDYSSDLKDKKSSKKSFNQIRQLTLKTNGIKLNNINSLTLPISLQTTLVDNSVNDELRLFSPQGRLLLRGPKSVHLESKLGDASIITFDDLVLRSNGGKIILDTDSIYIRRLNGNANKDWNQSVKQPKNITVRPLRVIDELIPKPNVYQLCICSNSGRLFLAKPDSICSIESYRDCR